MTYRAPPKLNKKTFTPAEAANQMLQEGHRNRIKGSACAMWYGTADQDEEVGTGSLLQIGRRYFLLTCEHVAVPFMKNPLLAFLNPSRPLDHTKMSLARKSRSRDVALIELHDFHPGNHLPIQASAFFFQRSMLRNKTKDKNYLVAGWPAEMVEASDHRRNFEMLFYGTAGYDAPQNGKHTFRVEYPNTTLGLPNGKGMSGSLLVEVLSGRKFKGRVLTYWDMPIVGMVTKWKPRRWLLCGNLWLLGRWIKEIEAEQKTK